MRITGRTNSSVGAVDRAPERSASGLVGTPPERSASGLLGTPPDCDDLITQLAAAQHGVVSRRQLLLGGIPPHLLDWRVQTGRLTVVYRGVYRVRDVSSPYIREMAALLACDGAAVICRLNAAWLWQWLPAPAATAPVQLLVRARNRGRAPGLEPHRVASLPADEVATRHGITLTSPARTLLDLAGVVGARQLEQALAKAERERTVERAALLVMLARHPRSHGARALRALLRSDTAPAMTRSEAEERLLALIRRARLPPPATNVVVAGYEVDFLWRKEALVVEVDGFAYHASARAFERDRRRDAALTAAGLRVMRLTWKQIVAEPEATLVRLAQALART